ncbi:MAG: hypothetical protein AB1498_00600 [bacterium]
MGLLTKGAANSKENPPDILLDIILFFATIVLAWFEKWAVKDILWSLWISSLILGYSYIITSIISALLRGSPAFFYNEEKSARLPLEFQTILMNIFVLFAVFMFFRWSLLFKMMLIIGLPGFILAIGVILRDIKKWDFIPDTNNLPVRIIMLLPISLFLLGFFTLHFLGFHFVHSIFLNGFFPLVQDNPFGKTPKGTMVLFGDLTVLSIKNYWPFIVLSALSRTEFISPPSVTLKARLRCSSLISMSSECIL